MNDLCAEIGFKSINHYGEQLCGDHIDIVEQNEDSTVIVLADGMGSGVKASILSTLTSKIISTMVAAGLSIEDCVGTKARFFWTMMAGMCEVTSSELAARYQSDINSKQAALDKILRTWYELPKSE